MIFQPPRTSFILSTAIVGLGLMSFPVIAEAGTCAPNGGPNTIVCSGAPDATNDVTQTITRGTTGTLVVNPGAGIDTTGSGGVGNTDALRIVAGGIAGETWVSTISDTARLTSNADALVLSTLGNADEDFVNTAIINGTVEGGALAGFDGFGVILLNQARGGGASGTSDINGVVNVGATGVVTGTTGAVQSLNSAAFSMTNAGSVTASTGTAVQVVGGNLTLNNSGTITGVTNGVIGDTNGEVTITNSGSITTTNGAALGVAITGNANLANGRTRTITNTGTLTSTNGLAVDVSNNQSMDQLRRLTLDLGGTISGGGRLVSSAGDADVIGRGTIGNDGNAIEVSGAGNTDITIAATGAVTSTAGTGVLQTTNGAGGIDFEIVAGGSVSGSANGVNLTNNGSGAVDVDVAGSISSAAGGGLIVADTTAGSGTDVDLTGASTISGATVGVSIAANGAGAATVDLNGAITQSGGAGTGAIITAGGSNTSLTVAQAASGSITGVTGGLNVTNTASGSATNITLNGSVTQTGGSTAGAVTVQSSAGAGNLALTLNGSVTGTASSGPLIDVDNTATGSTTSVTMGGGFTVGGGSTSSTVLDLDTGAASGGVTVDVQAGAAIASGSGDAINISALGTGVVGVNIARSVTGNIGDGLDVTAGANATGVDIDVAAAGSVTGFGTGIRAVHNGTGNLTIDVAGTAGDIFATTGGATTNVSVGSTGGAAGSMGAVLVNHAGAGSATVDLDKTGPAGRISIVTMVGTTATVESESAITTTSGTGIFVSHNGSGLASVVSNGAISAANGDGINAATIGAGLSITTGAGGTINGQRGIVATNAGTGTTSITTGAAITATSGVGILANNFSGGTDVNVTTNGTVNSSGSSTAINVTNSGTGATTVAVNADATSPSGTAVLVSAGAAATGTVTLTTGAASELSGVVGANVTNNGSGNTVVDLDGDITASAGSAILVANGSTAGTILFTSDGELDAGPSATAVSLTTDSTTNGGITATVNGLVTGGTLGSGVAMSSRQGAVSLTTGAGGDITAGGDAISVNQLATTAGAVTLVLDGSVESTSSDGIMVFSQGTGDVAITANDTVTAQGTTTSEAAVNVTQEGVGDVTVTTNAITSGGRGVDITRNGAGLSNITVNNTAALTGTAGSAIKVAASGGTGTSSGQILIDVDAAVSGGGSEATVDVTNGANSTSSVTVTADAAIGNSGTGAGVSVAQSANATGSLTIDVNAGGEITTGTGTGIVTTNLGTGLTDIDIEAALNSGGAGVSVTSSLGAISFLNTGAGTIDTVGDAIAITANDVAGGLSTATIDIQSAVTSTSGYGLTLSNFDADTTITASAAISAGRSAINASSGNGDLVINTLAGGALTATTTTSEFAIAASASNGDLTINTLGTIDARNGINAEGSAGSVMDIDVGAAVRGTNATGSQGVVVVADGAGSSIAFDNNAAGTISGFDFGLVVTDSVTTGQSVINIDGAITAATTGAQITVSSAAGLDLDVDAAITGTAGIGLQLFNRSAGAGLLDVDLGADGDITGATGIDFDGGPAVDLDFLSDVTSTGGAGIRVIGRTGGETIDISGNTDGTATASIDATGGDGILIGDPGASGQSVFGDISVTMAGTIDSDQDGIDIFNSGTGNISVTAGGAVTAGENGIEVATTGAGNILLDIDAAVTTTGTQAVVSASSTGAGDVRVELDGAVSGANAATGVALSNTTGGTLTLIGGTGGEITADTTGLSATNTAGTATLIDSDGDVTGDVGVTVAASGAGAGSTTLDLGGAITGRTGDAITATTTTGGALNITVSGAVTAADDGIDATNTGGTDSAITVASTGSINSVDGGILLTTSGSGAARIDVDGAVTRTGNVDSTDAIALSATGGTTSTIDVTANLTSNVTGVNLAHTGSGAAEVTLSNNATIAGNGGRGISSVVDGTTQRIATTAGTAVTASEIGIYAQNDGTGLLTLDLDGTVSGGTTGIRAVQSGAGMKVDIDGTLAGGADGVSLLSDATSSGSVDVDVTATITGAANGLVIEAQNTSSVDLDTSAQITGNGGNGVQITSTGTTGGVNADINAGVQGNGANGGIVISNAKTAGTETTLLLDGAVTMSAPAAGSVGVSVTQSNSAVSGVTVTTGNAGTISDAFSGLVIDTQSGTTTDVDVAGAINLTGASGNGDRGIAVTHAGSGALTLDTVATGTVTIGGQGSGIVVSTNDTASTINVGGAVDAGDSALVVTSNGPGNGAVNVTATAGLIGRGASGGAGVNVLNDGAGVTNVTLDDVQALNAGVILRSATASASTDAATLILNGDVTGIGGTGNRTGAGGVLAETESTGLLTVELRGSVESTGTGIDVEASTSGDARVVVTAAGSVDSSGQAMDIDGGSGNVTIVTDGSVQGVTNGISAVTTGTGRTVSVTTNDTVATTTGTAISVLATTGTAVVNTTDLVSATGAGAQGIEAVGATVSATVSGTVTANADAITLTSPAAPAGANTITANVSGAVTSNAARGLVVTSAGAPVDIDLSAAIDAATGGIAVSSTDGAVTVDTTAAGDIATTTGAGISANSGSAPVTLVTAGTVSGASGIAASGGTTSVTANDDVTGTIGIAINAVSTGTSRVMTGADAAVEGVSGGIATSGSGAVVVTAAGTVAATGGDGIVAQSTGGTVNVTTSLAVTGSDDGIVVGDPGGSETGAGAYTVIVNGPLTGTNGIGLDVNQAGLGAIDIDASGPINAGTSGIDAQILNTNSTAALDITTDAAATITSGGTGIVAGNSGNGATTVLVQGAVDATGNGATITSTGNAAGVGAVSFTNTGAITSDATGLSLTTSGAAAFINVNAAINADASGVVADVGTQGVTFRNTAAVNAGTGAAVSLTADNSAVTATIDGTLGQTTGATGTTGLDITTGGAIIANVNAGIDVIGNGLTISQTGNSQVDVDLQDDVTSSAGAVAAISNTGSSLTTVSVGAGTVSSGATGISIDSGAAGTGRKDVTVAGSVTATAGSAMSLTSTVTGPALSTVNVQSTGRLDGSTTGLSLAEADTPVGITIAGTVLGGTTAVDIDAGGSVVDLNVNDAAVITGGTDGVSLVSGSATTVTADIAENASVTGTNGTALDFELNGTSTLALNVNGTVSGNAGLALSGTSTQTATVVVNGTLTATGGTAIDADNILLNLTVDGDVTGNIQGGAPGSQITFTSGLIDGNIVLDSGVDTLDLGQINVTGNVSTGAGNDVVTMSVGTQQLASGTMGPYPNPNLDLGADDDTLNVIGTGGAFDDADRDGIMDIRGPGGARLFTASGGSGTDIFNLTNANTSAEAFEEFTGFETLNLIGSTFDSAELGGSARTLVFDNLIIGAGSRFLADGNSPMRTQTVGDVTNGGVGIDLRDQTAGTVDAVAGDGDDVMIIGGDYTGNGGRIFLDVALDATGVGPANRAGNPDGPDADFVVINGNVSGTPTELVVNNIGNGVGSLTGADSIVLVEVDGTVNANDFTLAGGSLGTAGFLYTLDFTGSAFVLRSEVSGAGLQYPVVANAAFGFGVDLLGTMASRSSARQGYGADAALGEVAQMSFAEVERGYAGGSWIRVIAATGNSDGDVGGLPIKADFDHTRTAFQAGYDFELARTATSRVMGTVSAHVGQVTQDASGANGALRADGDANVIGLGFGATYTTNSGFYMDAGINVSSFDYDFETQGAGRGSTDGIATVAKLEIGQRYEMENVTLIPQAQLNVGQTRIDDFTDSNGVVVDFDNGTFSELRLGVRAERDQANGGLLYGGLDVISDLSGETTTTVSGTDLTYEEDGASVKISGGYRSAPVGSSASFFGEFGYESGADRDETSVTGGVSLRF